MSLIQNSNSSPQRGRVQSGVFLPHNSSVPFGGGGITLSINSQGTCILSRVCSDEITSPFSAISAEKFQVPKSSIENLVILIEHLSLDVAAI